MRRFLREHQSRFASDQTRIWKVLGGLPEGIKRLLNTELQKGEIDLEEELERIVLSHETRHMLRHWELDLGGERFQVLFQRSAANPDHVTQLKRLGLLVDDGKGGLQEPARLFGAAPTRSESCRLCFVYPDASNLGPGDRGAIGLGPGQVGAVAVVGGEASGSVPLENVESWGVSARDFLVLYAMAVAGRCAPPGASADELGQLARYLGSAIPWLSALAGLQGEEEGGGAAVSKAVSGARQKIGLAATYFSTPGRGHSAPYGVSGEVDLSLIPYVLTRRPEGLRLVPADAHAVEDTYRAIRRRYANIPLLALDGFGDPKVALEELLGSVFDGPELLRFLSADAGTAPLLRDLPGPNPKAELAHQTVRLLDQHGLIQDRLFECLMQHRPRRADYIQQVQQRWRAWPRP